MTYAITRLDGEYEDQKELLNRMRNGQTRTWTAEEITHLNPRTWGKSDLLLVDGSRLISNGVNFVPAPSLGGAATVDATGFDGNLAPTDNTLQKVAQKVDDLVLGGGSNAIDAAGFDGNLAPTDNTTQKVAQKLDDLALGTGAPATKQAKINQVFIDAANGATAQYIVSGDSTRDNTYNQMQSYYTDQLAKINVTSINNSQSGQSAYDWANNVDGATVDQAIAAITGDGASSVLELSYGINDFKVTAQIPAFDPNSQVHFDLIKSYIQTGIDALITAKPLLTIVLVTPVYTADLLRNTKLQLMYQELSVTNNLVLVDPLGAMGAVHGSTIYYQDGTHPNKSGSRRLVNFILNDIVPAQIKSLVDLEEFPVAASSGSPTNIFTSVATGFLDKNSGTAIANPDWRRSSGYISVEPNFTVNIDHGGNRTDVIFYTAADVYISWIASTVIAGETYRQVIVPANAYKMAFNINSATGVAAYDALNYAPNVYVPVSVNVLPTVKEINSGLDIDFNNEILNSYSKADTQFALAIDATGFNGNLATTDNTIQKVAQKVDDLVLGGGGGAMTGAQISTALFAENNTNNFDDAAVVTLANAATNQDLADALIAMQGTIDAQNLLIGNLSATVTGLEAYKPETLTQAAYTALVAAGTVVEGKNYTIKG